MRKTLAVRGRRCFPCSSARSASSGPPSRPVTQSVSPARAPRACQRPLDAPQHRDADGKLRPAREVAADDRHAELRAPQRQSRPRAASPARAMRRSASARSTMPSGAAPIAARSLSAAAAARYAISSGESQPRPKVHVLHRRVGAHRRAATPAGHRAAPRHRRRRARACPSARASSARCRTRRPGRVRRSDRRHGPSTTLAHGRKFRTAIGAAPYTGASSATHRAARRSRRAGLRRAPVRRRRSPRRAREPTRPRPRTSARCSPARAASRRSRRARRRCRPSRARACRSRSRPSRMPSLITVGTPLSSTVAFTVRASSAAISNRRAFTSSGAMPASRENSTDMRRDDCGAPLEPVAQRRRRRRTR